jgi:hypothetical protein
MGAWKLSAGGAAAALLVTLWLTIGSAASPQPPPPESPQPAAAPATRDIPRGAGSCSATACHGGMSPLAAIPGVNDNALRDEHTTWTSRDKHARAYQVLLDPRSESIARNLARRTGQEVAAHKDGRCLACHATPTAGLAAGGPAMAGGVETPDAETILTDGVSCESCHGPSGRWIREHTKFDWRGRSPEEKRRWGMYPTSPLVDRVQTCVGCHVGAPPDADRGLPARDVNHDLIAAGHPRLNFEFGAYLANEPKHWRIGPNGLEAGAAADFEARAWAIGQAASMKAELQLLAWRADEAAKAQAQVERFESQDPGKPVPAGLTVRWPEYTEYGCFSCHFNIQQDSWRNKDKQHRDPEQPLGVPNWASWYAPMVRDLAGREGDAGKKVDAGLKDLRATMSVARPEPGDAAKKARAAADALDGLLAQLQREDLGPSRIEELLTAFRLPKDPADRPEGVYSWDHAAQRYLALVALNQALAQEQGKATVPPEVQGYLDQILNGKGGLKFPPKYDSPEGFRLDPAAAK